MRFIVFGAGGVGGVVGARLAEHGHDVILIGRGDHFTAVKELGLCVESPETTVTIKLPIVEHPAHIRWAAGDVVLLTMKTQDTLSAVDALAATAPAATPIVCVQNSVENERIALRRFAEVYGVCVMCPTGFLKPGVVQAWSSPVTGILDVGRYPTGSGDVAEAISAALRCSTFSSEVRQDIMRWKYGKLLTNLGNAIEAISGPTARSGRIAELARKEASDCLKAAGIPFISEEEDTARRADLLRVGSIGGRERSGGSSWQSLHRRTHSIETDYLNGEIVLLGRLHGVPTPVNALLQRVANQMALEERPPGWIPAEALLRGASLDPWHPVPGI